LEGLPAIAYGDVDLGYHELVDEVLTVDVHESAARYFTAVYLTTPLEDRADALCQAIGASQEVACTWKPLEQMERSPSGSPTCGGSTRVALAEVSS